MQNLRILSVQINSNSNMDIRFTSTLTPNLIPDNLSIVSQTPNVPSSKVLKIIVSNDNINVTCQPLTPLSAYEIVCASVPSFPFISLHGDAKVSEDGVSNVFFITGPIEPENPIKNYLLAYLKDNIYNVTDDNTVVAQYINSLATVLVRALHDVDQVKNENYLSFTVTDEQQTRGQGPFDRLHEECAYEIIRVGRSPTNAIVTQVTPIADFPDYPITLQQQNNLDILKVNSIDSPGVFNINTLTLNLTKSPVTRVNSIVFNLTTMNPVYDYSISELGYQILDSRYDQDFASDYLLLQNNQIRLNEKILQDSNFSLNNILNIQVNYESKDLGKVINASTVTVTTVKTSIREVLPPIINIFNLQNAPVTDSNGNVSKVNGVVFTDPNSNTGAPHPAFVTELPFRLNSLPFAPGQYTIDYSTGTVYVYGASQLNDGTGPFPPLATYNYLFTYKPEQDYVYDSDLLDLVSLPVGNLTGNQGNITFNYEEVFIPGTDYIADLHLENLTERVGNNLVALNVIKSQNSPITNVFRILNETSGEIYTLDRWNDNKIYFRYNTPPNIVAQVRERASFEVISNELLFVNTVLINGSGFNIFKIYLQNNDVIAGTEDSLGSSFNSSVVFTNSDIFVNEKWWNRQLAENINIARLSSIGQYMIDYENGIIYCAVANINNTSIGSVTYKASVIIPQFPHVISTDDIYYQISSLEPKNKQFTYLSFADGSITPSQLDPSDELSLNGDNNSIYQLNNGAVGTYMSTSFISGVTNQVKFIRSIFEYDDLLYSTHPLNFASFSTSNDFTIQVGPVTGQVFENVQFNGTNYYVTLNQNIPYLSNNIVYQFSVIRLSDSAALWNGSVIPGNPVTLLLTNAAHVGDLVSIIFTYTINSGSRVAIDYNRGDYFVDYTYVADEIVLSYEYGDNVLDFRQGSVLSAGETYYVSYKAGALRDALLRNFGNLVNVPELTNFDIDFDRERYRDALTAALTSFIQGPTISAMKNIGKTISHIEPEITESVFQNWSLGSSLLNPEPIETTGSFQLLPAVHSNGVMIDTPGQTISFPANSNIRLEEGTFETWVIPSWNGIDNDALLTFNILRNGNPVNFTRVFIGASEKHPTSGTFTISKDDAQGTPNMNKYGAFIYYDEDVSGLFDRWYIRVIDLIGTATYTFNITSNGQFYDTKSTVSPKPSNVSLMTGTRGFNVVITGLGSYLDQTVTFVSDVEHFILDFAEAPNKNRLSIFKDASGYMNFRVFDKESTMYSLSKDVSSWSVGESHHVAASWKLNTRTNRDEMHLFIDGFEVPNIVKYGQKLQPYLHEKFRTVDPEEIIGSPTRDIVGANDLVTTAGMNTVSSSINFSAHNIFVGDIIHIDEIGFAGGGYMIVNINGQTLTLATPMPQSLTNGRFSVNRTNFTVKSEIDIVPNMYISVINPVYSGSDMAGVMSTGTVTSAGSNFITAGIKPGYTLRVDNSSLNITYTILQVSATSLTINGTIPINFSSNVFRIYDDTEIELPGLRAVTPTYSISQDVYFNNILTISNDVKAGDLILLRTLGLNFRRVKKDYYVWSNNIENMLLTSLPAPISLNEVSIKKIVLPMTAIGSSNSTLTSGVFHSNNLSVSQPITSHFGRTLNVIVGGVNTDFSTAVQVNINGVSNGNTITETITFTNYESIHSVNRYTSVNYINVIAKPLNQLRNVLNVTVKELYTMTYGEIDGYAPIVRYSYPIAGGTSLSGSGNTITDSLNMFSSSQIGDYIYLSSPAPAAGTYQITEVSVDLHSLTIAATLPTFSNGVYQILNVNSYRSGLQNGFFTFEVSNLPGQPYLLNSGFYELTYYTYMTAKMSPGNAHAYLGTSFEGHRLLNGILDQVKIYSTMLTDTRVGETIPSNQRSITKDFNSLKALTSDNNTLMLISFDSFPFVNSANWIVAMGGEEKFFNSSLVVNENFGNSLVFLNKPLVLQNNGILDARKQGTIEFWMNPLFDTGNDPARRYYFDAFGAITEEVVSADDVSVKVSGSIGKVISVKLKGGDPRIDYFSGGKVEVDTQRAISEEGFSFNNSTVVVSQPILQVITVKIIGDLTGTDYFAGGAVGTDRQTIYLGKVLPSNDLPLLITYQSTANNNVQINTQVIRLNRKLPYQKSNVIVNYIPGGLQGDRISIFKDENGFMNFSIMASGQDYTIKLPTRWSTNTWHRLKASYRINGGIGQDEMRFFVDGYQYDTILSGGFPTNPDGYTFTGAIKFKDPINQLVIGTQYDGQFPVFSLIDNFRISDISRPIYAPYGEPIDVNYSSNLNIVFPVTQDLYTTFLLNDDLQYAVNTDFTTLKNRETGLFDFSINIIDSLGIVQSSIKSKEALEEIINILKPANSRVFIQYTS